MLGHYRVYMPVSCGGLALGLSAGGTVALKSALVRWSSSKRGPFDTVATGAGAGPPGLS